MPLSPFLLAACVLVQAPTLPLVQPAEAMTLDQVLARNYEVRGGLEKIKSLKSFRLVMTFGDQKSGFPMSIEARRPDHFRAELLVNGVKIMQGFDGKTGWVVNQFSTNRDPQTMSAAELAKLKLQADMDGPLVDWKEKGHRIELAGIEKLPGGDAIKLKITFSTGQEIFTFLDAKTFLEVKQVASRVLEGKQIDNESTSSDYRTVEGYVFPFHQELTAKGSKVVQTMTVNTVDINPELGDDRFAEPPKPPAIDKSTEPPKPAPIPGFLDPLKEGPLPTVPKKDGPAPAESKPLGKVPK